MRRVTPERNVQQRVTGRERSISEDGKQWIAVADAVAEIGLQSALDHAAPMDGDEKDTLPSGGNREHSKSSLWFILDDDELPEEPSLLSPTVPIAGVDLAEEKLPSFKPHRVVAAAQEIDPGLQGRKDLDDQLESSVPTKRRKTRRDSAAPVATVTLALATPPKRTERKRKARRRPPSRICKYEGCEQYVVDQGLCVRHGGGKRCEAEGCTSRAKHQGKCWKHGGSTACKIAGCPNRAKSRGYCWSHGGGTKCKTGSCDKIAISNGLCWAHGGGKRCVVDGCKRQAYERTQNYCNTHYHELFAGGADVGETESSVEEEDVGSEEKRTTTTSRSLKRSAR